MLFVQDQYSYLLPDCQQQDQYLVSQFDNQELLVRINTQALGSKKYIVLGSLTAPCDQALQLLLLLHTLYKAGRTSLVLISPYLGYQRQEQQNFGVSCGLQWADAMLHAAGVTQLLTLDMHNQESLRTLQVPLISYSTQLLFEEEMAYFVSLGFTFVFPDSGAQLRYHWIGVKFPTVCQAWFSKSRVHGMMHVQGWSGKLSRKVIMYDDILDSGQTLVQICILLRQMGVEEIVIFVTHAFFHGQAWNDLWNLGVKILYCTDSLPNAHQIKHPQIYVKSIASFLQKDI